jgi:hypothetical protein
MEISCCPANRTGTDTFADLDRVECELKKAAKAIGSASGLVGKYRGRLQVTNVPVGIVSSVGREDRHGGHGRSDGIGRSDSLEQFTVSAG